MLKAAVLIAMSLGLTRLWVADGPRLPFIYIALWIIGLIIFSQIALGKYYFMSYEALLAAVTLLHGQYKAS